MKRLAPLFLIVAVLLAIFHPRLAAAAEVTPSPDDDRSPGAALATTVSTVTGIAISPLLGTGVYGACQWAEAGTEAERARLPWYAHMSFWLPALVVVGLCAAKDSLGTVLPPGFKKPLDMLETVENKVSGLVAAGAVIPLITAEFSRGIAGGRAAAAAGHGFAGHGFAMISLGMGDASWLLNLLAVPAGLAMFAVVWMAAHAVTVLVLLSPWGAIDAALKALRTALLVLLAATALVNPRVGAALSLLVIVIAYLLAGWAFRLTVFGGVFCWDFLTVRRVRFSPAENDNRVFAGANLPGVPPRMSGRLVLRSGGALEFYYRPWLVLAERSAAVPGDRAQLAVGKGLFFSSIGGEATGTLFLLPPRYHGHEEVVARAYLLGGGVKAAGLRRAWNVLKELFGGVAARTQVV